MKIKNESKFRNFIKENMKSKQNILNKTLEIEDKNGNNLLQIKVDSYGNMELINCEIADIETKNTLRIQQIN